jgi:hypothetical protein
MIRLVQAGGEENGRGIEERKLYLKINMTGGKPINASMRNTTMGTQTKGREWKLGHESVRG